MNRASDGAETRVVRVVCALFGVGSVVFVALLLPAVLAQTGDDVPAWWVDTTLVGVLLLPVLMTASAAFVPVRVLAILASGTAVIYLLALLTLPAVQLARVGVHDTAPWILGLTAIGTTAAAIVWPGRLAWPYLAAVTVLVAVDRIATAAAPLTEVAVQDAAYAGFFGAVFCALAIGARGAGRAVDRASAEALEAAVVAADRRAREQERRRIDALVHDEVLATLLVASRSDDHVDEAVRASATRALGHLRALTAEVEAENEVSRAAIADRIRGATTDTAPDAVVAVDRRDARPVPGRVADAVVAAATEAIRNAVLHAGPGARITVAVSGAGTELAVDVVDDGTGFDAAQVRPTRLGLAGSVILRMQEIGGTATVTSRTGAGTAVRLRWPSP